MKLNIPILAIGILVIANSCSTKSNEHDHDGEKDHANHHMNKTPFDELVKRFESSERDEWQRPEKVIEFLGDLKNKTIVDIGAGTGYFEFKINEPSAKIIAADVDARFIKYLNERITSEKKTNIFSRKAEFDKPPVTENEADVVFMVDVYHHIENRVDYFSKLKTSLKPNGELVIVDFKKGDFEHGPPDEMKLAPEQIITELAKAGFENTVIDTTTLQFQYLLKFK